MALMQESSTTTAPSPTTTTTANPATTIAAKDPLPVGPSGLPSPPVIELRGGGKELALRPTSYCWSGDGKGACVTGVRSQSPPDIGSPAEIEVGFDAPNWRFTATAVITGQRCGRAQTVTLDPTGPTTYRLRPIGAAGDYVISLFGRGAKGAVHGGDVSASFRWHTPSDGPNVAPVATASIVAGRPPESRSYGVEMSIRNLRSSPGPDGISASAVVTSSDGASMAIDLERKSLECSPEGSVAFAAAKELGDQAARLGSAPFRYDVTVVISGMAYRGTGTWPDDVDSECSPCTRMQFSPPLPGL